MNKFLTLFTLTVIFTGSMLGMDLNNKNVVVQNNPAATITITFKCIDGDITMQKDSNIFMQSKTLKNCLSDSQNASLEIALDCTQKDVVVMVKLLECIHEGQTQVVEEMLQNASLEELLCYLKAFDFLDVKKELFEQALSVCAEKLLNEEFSGQVKKELMATNSIFDILPETVGFQLAQHIRAHIFHGLKETNTFSYGHNFILIWGFIKHGFKLSVFDENKNLLICTDRLGVVFLQKNQEKFEQLNYSINTNQSIIHLALSPDGKYLAIHTEYSIFIYTIADLENIQQIAHFPRADNTWNICFLDKQKLLIVEDCQPSLYDINTQHSQRLDISSVKNRSFFINSKKNICGILSEYGKNNEMQIIGTDRRGGFIINIHTITENKKNSGIISKGYTSAAFIFDNHIAAVFEKELAFYDVSNIANPINIQTLDLKTLKPDLEDLLICKTYGSTLFTLDKNGVMHVWAISKNCKVKYINSLGEKIDTFQIYDNFLTATSFGKTQIFSFKKSYEDLTLKQAIFSSVGTITQQEIQKNEMLKTIFESLPEEMQNDMQKSGKEE